MSSTEITIQHYRKSIKACKEEAARLLRMANAYERDLRKLESQHEHSHQQEG